MRNTVITVAILAAIGVGGYIWYGAQQQVDDASGVVMPEGATVDAPVALPDASSAVGGATEIVAPVDQAVEETQATADAAATEMGDITPETVVEAPAETATAPVENTTATGSTKDQGVSNDTAAGVAVAVGLAAGAIAIAKAKKDKEDAAKAEAAAEAATPVAVPDETELSTPAPDMSDGVVVPVPETPAEAETAAPAPDMSGDAETTAPAPDMSDGVVVPAPETPAEAETAAPAPDMADGVVVPAPDMSATAEDISPEELLTAEGFDAEKIIALIDEADILPARKALLRTAVERASENPQLLQSALERVKLALGY